MGLVALEPDLGTAALIAVAGALVIVLAGLRVRVMVALLLLGAVGAWFGWSFMHDYQRRRVLTFLNPQTDPLGAGYHIIQSQIAIGSGGIFGKGWMNGSQAQLEFLPERSTDFMFAVVGEEFGLLGLLLLLLLYLFVVARSIYLATQTQDTFARLLAGSIALTFFVYVLINAGMVTGLLPGGRRAATPRQLRRQLGCDAPRRLRYSHGALLPAQARRLLSGHGFILINWRCALLAALGSAALVGQGAGAQQPAATGPPAPTAAPATAAPATAAPATAAPATAAPATAAPATAAPATAAAPAEPTATPFDVRRPEIAQWIEEVVSHDGWSRKSVVALLGRAQPQPKVLEIMGRPLERVAPWWEYRERFMTPERIEKGVQLWLDHRLTLERIAAQYQVPPEYLVAIVGVETFYGRTTCRYRVLDALATLAFDYPPRASYFRGELEQFLLLTRENKLDPLTTCGSYAGAMGVPQFMPSSLPALRGGRRQRQEPRPVGRLGRHPGERRELSARMGLDTGERRCWPRPRSIPTRASRSSRTISTSTRPSAPSARTASRWPWTSRPTLGRCCSRPSSATAPRTGSGSTTSTSSRATTTARAMP